MLGPTLLFLALKEKAPNKVAKTISVYGKVPIFYYLVHLYLIHSLAVLAASSTGFNWSDMTGLTSAAATSPKLKGYGFDLWLVYVIWAVVVALFPLCKWYSFYKERHKHNVWFSYI
jgi:hypothetical protein